MRALYRPDAVSTTSLAFLCGACKVKADLARCHNRCWVRVAGSFERHSPPDHTRRGELMPCAARRQQAGILLVHPPQRMPVLDLRHVQLESWPAVWEELLAP
jgi:hypothetical protein